MSCCICFEDFDNESNKVELDCNHSYHLFCFIKMTQTCPQKDKCAMCRKKIVLPECNTFTEQEVSILIEDFRTNIIQVIASKMNEYKREIRMLNNRLIMRDDYIKREHHKYQELLIKRDILDLELMIAKNEIRILKSTNVKSEVEIDELKDLLGKCANIIERLDRRI